MTWLTVTLAALTAAALIRFFWMGNSGTVSVRAAVLTGGLVIAFLASIRVSPISWGVPRLRTVASPASSVAPTTVPVSVQGASLTRDEAARLDSCESALTAIAQAVDRAASDGAKVTPAGTPTDGRTDPNQRLTSCEVRLKAIAATLPAGG